MQYELLTASGLNFVQIKNIKKIKKEVLLFSFCNVMQDFAILAYFSEQLFSQSIWQYRATAVIVVVIIIILF